jgi:hypothetical protein
MDEILKEVSELRGDTSYVDSIMEKSRELNEINNIRFFYGLLYLFDISPLDAIEIVKETGIKQNDKEKVQRKLNNLIFDRKVAQEKEKGKSKKKPTTFEEMCVSIETYFNCTLDYNITVSKFIAYENRIKAIEERKKLNKAM